MNRIEYFYHVTSPQNKEGIINVDGRFRLYPAGDEQYDGCLARFDAPRVCFFSASLYNSRLPTTTPYPHCNFQQDRPCTLASSTVPRIRILTEPIIDRLNTDQYRLYHVKSFKPPTDSFTHHLFLISNDSHFLWSERNLTRLKHPNDSILALNNKQLTTVDMNQKHIVNVAFTFDLSEILAIKGASTIDKVTHKCSHF